jgi:lipoate-protein ligase A
MLLGYMLANLRGCELYRYSDTDIAAINRLRDDKYSTWDWNFGASPGYNMVKSVRTGGGNMELHLDVKNGTIMHLRIFGDFFNIKDMAELERIIAGAPHSSVGIRERLANISIADYFVNISLDEFIAAII